MRLVPAPTNGSASTMGSAQAMRLARTSADNGIGARHEVGAAHGIGGDHRSAQALISENAIGAVRSIGADRRPARPTSRDRAKAIGGTAVDATRPGVAEVAAPRRRRRRWFRRDRGEELTLAARRVRRLSCGGPACVARASSLRRARRPRPLDRPLPPPPQVARPTDPSAARPPRPTTPADHTANWPLDRPRPAAAPGRATATDPSPD